MANKVAQTKGGTAWRQVLRGGGGGGGAGSPGAWGSARRGHGPGATLARGIVTACLLLLGCSLCWSAEETAYHTPLAGEAKRVTFMGQRVDIPAVDRADMTSITVGASLLAPAQGESPIIPAAALYHRRVADSSYRRAMVAVFVNELDYLRDLGGWDLVAQFENDTPPVAGRELRNGDEIRGTALYHGILLGSLGVGWRRPVYPFQVDNDLRVQLVARGGYFYAHRETDSAPGLWVPPNTPLYGARLRCRYDGMRRNLLELPHLGMAAGFDVDHLHRDTWRGEAGSADGGNRDYTQAEGHLVAAGGVPGLSERNRLLFSLYGGFTAQGRGDRFNAFRLNGGPFPSEQYDLAWPHYSGVIYDRVLARGYASASAGYRRELTFFMYLSTLGSYVWADRSTAVGNDRVDFDEMHGAAATVALDSAFFWDSSLYLAWSWESGVMRNGRSGNGVTLMWNKLF
ncbi:porin [Geomonas nitrogeniifigens]|uniref:Porin n=1 Tax=Geomonas diazotrophica TaxID=2843197 RepID=A0ABX8JK67_9BACT|nr:porin [Geomonas nitrogeniifigens]QWV95865.1 porin [Geomonas nitrogeniifigens]